MKIHGLSLIRDEADIIEESLLAALVWCDYIYVYDNGSEDGTWEKVIMLSRRHPQIIPFKQDAKAYHEGLRMEMFQHYRQSVQGDDWWCYLDADEFFIENPHIFLQKVPAMFKSVANASLSYYFTDKDAERYRLNPELYADEVPVNEKCRYYVCHWSEIRFWRHCPSMTWGERSKYPAEIWPLFPMRICAKHFAYRSPQQIDRRLRTRAQAPGSFAHEFLANWGEVVGNMSTERSHGLTKFGLEHVGTSWEQRIVPAAKMNFDEHNGRYVIDEHLMPSIESMSPSEHLSLVDKIKQAIPADLKKAIKRIYRSPLSSQSPQPTNG